MFDFVADLADTHNGDARRCARLVEKAADIGCKGVILDVSRVEEVYAPEVLRVGPALRLRRRRELPRHEMPDLVTLAHRRRLRCGLRMADLDGVELAADQADFLVIGAHELPWLDLVLRCAETGLPLVIETAMGEAGEVWNAIETALEAGCPDLTLLHGVQRQPTPPEAANLAAIGTLRELLVGEFEPLYPDVRFHAGWSDLSGDPGVVSRALHHWAAEMVVLRLDLDGRGDGFGAGHCWLPDRAAAVVAGGFLPVRRNSDGSGRLAPDACEMDERGWRADVADGLRPVRAIRGAWARSQPEATRTGPDVYMVVDGPGNGAISRTLALAETLREDHDADVVFLVRELNAATTRLLRHGFNAVPYEELENVPTQVGFMNGLSAEAEPPLCIVDVEDTGPAAAALTDELADVGAVVVVIGTPPGQAVDLVVVPEFGWRSEDGPHGALGGSAYLPIDEDTRYWREARPAWDGPATDYPRIVVLFDRGDPRGLTDRVTRTLYETRPRARVQVVVPPTTVRGDVVAGLLEGRCGDFRVVADGSDPRQLIAGADLLITSPGPLVADALFLGVPSLLIAQERDEVPAAARFAAAGCAADLGLGSDLTDAGLAERLGHVLDDPEAMSRLRFHAQDQAAAPVDGLGASRAADRIVALLRGRG